MPSQEETRWRSFKQMNRNRPLKQVRILVTFVLLCILYAYCLLSLQPEQSQEYVVEYNIKEAKRHYEEQRRIEEARRERQQDLAKRREEARVRRIKARNATLSAFRLNQTMANNTTNAETPESQPTAIGRFVGVFLSFIGSVFMCAGAKFLVRLCAPPPPEPRPRSRRNERETRFREWAQRLNQQRQEQGERPLSLQSLRLVMRGRDFSSGNDYEGLLQFNEEAGPAMHALLQSMGATQEEIDRCPHRMLVQGDDLLQSVPDKEPPHCAVCLERYVVSDKVRTIPCFHTFHTRCIDPWLTQKAVCPVCKHPAVG